MKKQQEQEIHYLDKLDQDGWMSYDDVIAS